LQPITLHQKTSFLLTILEKVSVFIDKNSSFDKIVLLFALKKHQFINNKVQSSKDGKLRLKRMSGM
jgi:hypothetical protein